MSCKEAMITEVITARPDQTVEDVLALFDKHKINTVPVVDEKYALCGLFGFSDLLDSLLPISFDEDDEAAMHFKHVDVNLDFLEETKHWVAGRLNNVKDRKVEELMRKGINYVGPDTPLREGMRLTVKYGSPIPVVEEEKLVGIISSQTIVKTLKKVADSIKEAA
jgi:CBS domain-containing protein